MFKSIKEFFLGKPKSEVVAEQPVVPAPVAAPIVEQPTAPAPVTVPPVVEPQVLPVAEIDPSSKTTLDTETWPVKPLEKQTPNVKKKRTFVKRDEPTADTSTKPPKQRNRKKK